MVGRSNPQTRWQLATSAPRQTQLLKAAGCKVGAAGLWARGQPVFSTACQRAAYKHNGRCALHGGRSTGPKTKRGVQRISEPNLKHGRQTKEKLAAQRHVAMVRRRVMGELKQLERQLAAAGLMPEG